MINRVLSWLFGEKCPKCGKRSHHSGQGYYTRGYNNMCHQACGDWGWYCFECSHIEWNRSLLEYKASLPDWCEANEECQD